MDSALAGLPEFGHVGQRSALGQSWAAGADCHLA